jgi:F-type H+-transporting ATPase subunit b
MLMNPEFYVLLAFLIFFGLFGRVLWRAVAGMLDGHANVIRVELEEAAKLRAEAEQMLRDAQAARAAALDEARDILTRSRAEAANVTQAAYAEAEAQARRRERLALDRISAAEKAVITEIQQIAADVAVQAARVVIAETLSTADDAAIVDHAIAALPRALRAA